jgi:hypothetical protein
MLPAALLRFAALYLLLSACTPLDGRAAPADAARADVLADAPPDASPTPDVAPDVPRPPTDAPACPRGEAAAVDARFALTLASDSPGAPTNGATARVARLDPMGRILIAGLCVRCTAADRSVAAVWRVDAATLRHDTSFGGAGVAADPAPARAVDQWSAVTSDALGRVYLAGTAASGSSTTAVVARLLPDGRDDPTFGTAGQLRLSRGTLSSLPVIAVPTAIHRDADGLVVTLIDQHTWFGPATRAWALRIDDGGRLDASFGDRGIQEIDDVHGCFDLAREGGDYVLACASLTDRPALRRLGANGRPVAWASGAPAEAQAAPARFFVRTLARDGVGRWVVVGSVSATYNGSSAPVAAVRFLPDGSHDRAYGVGGVTVFLGPSQSFGYTYASTSRLGCDDRLLFGAAYSALPVVGFVDAAGTPLEAVGDFGNLLLPQRAGAAAVVVAAIVPVPGSQDVVVVVTHAPAATTVHRLAL